MLNISKRKFIGLSLIFFAWVNGAVFVHPTARANESIQPPREASDMEQGRRIYNFRCYFCHGYSGDARTLAAEFLVPRPRDFTGIGPSQLSREQMLQTVQAGRPGTAMQPFDRILNGSEIAAVVDFVRAEFMREQRVNTRYHTTENGWIDHDRFSIAFPFATGEIALDTPTDSLDARQKAGRALYLASCVSCHDRGRVRDARPVWEPRVLSYPRLDFKPGDATLTFDAISGATPYARHDIPPPLADASADAIQGESLFQKNCAFCHAADGSGRNWIGTFLQPSPRDLTDSQFMSNVTRDYLLQVIRKGLPGTSMPAWQSVLTEAEIRVIVAYIHKAFHPVAN